MTKAIKPPELLAKRRHRFQDPALDATIDDLLEALARQAAAIRELQQRATGAAQAYNSGELAIAPGLLCGLDAAGRLALATGAAAAPIEPLLATAELAQPLAAFGCVRAGETRVRIESEDETPTPGTLAWLSASAAGTVTATRPATGKRWRVGWFAAGGLDAAGTVPIYLEIAAMGSTAP